jgi:hypothetical protein
MLLTRITRSSFRFVSMEGGAGGTADAEGKEEEDSWEEEGGRGISEGFISFEVKESFGVRVGGVLEFA